MTIFAHFFRCLKNEDYNTSGDIKSADLMYINEKIWQIVKFYQINQKAFEIEFKDFSDKVYIFLTNNKSENKALYLVLRLL